MSTCECGLSTTTVAHLTHEEHMAAHNEAAAPWVTFHTFRLPGGQRVAVQKRNGSTRTVTS